MFALRNQIFLFSFFHVANVFVSVVVVMMMMRRRRWRRRISM